MGRAFRTIYHIMHVAQSTRTTRCKGAAQDDSSYVCFFYLCRATREIDTRQAFLGELGKTYWEQTLKKIGKIGSIEVVVLTCEFEDCMFSY